jgi:conjugative relaxase-like TrwC/TraI family protein
MTAQSIGAGDAVEYARYLESKTVAPARGDYYLGPSSEAAQAPGRWHIAPDTLERLGVTSQDGQVQGKDFVRLMEGRHPGTGDWLRAAGAGGGRGGGIDVCFSAPKSVSVVWALGDSWQREQIEQAHGRAVARTLAYLRERVGVVRRRYGEEVVEEPAKDLLAVEYRHTTARGVAGAETPDPQVHSHVVITGAVRDDGRFVAVASRPVFRSGYPHHQRRVENGSQGQITRAEHNEVTVTLDGTGRQATLAGEDLDVLRFGYAHHVYRQQGATVDARDRPHRRLADQQGDRLRPSHPRSPTNPLARRPRRARHRRHRSRPDHTPFEQDVRKQSPSAVRRTRVYLRSRRRGGAWPYTA